MKRMVQKLLLSALDGAGGFLNGVLDRVAALLDGIAADTSGPLSASSTVLAAVAAEWQFQLENGDMNARLTVTAAVPVVDLVPDILLVLQAALGKPQAIATHLLGAFRDITAKGLAGLSDLVVSAFDWGLGAAMQCVSDALAGALRGADHLIDIVADLLQLTTGDLAATGSEFVSEVPPAHPSSAPVPGRCGRDRVEREGGGGGGDGPGRREERVTVQGPVKRQRPHGMSHRGMALGPHHTSCARCPPSDTKGRPQSQVVFPFSSSGTRAMDGALVGGG